MTTFDDDMQDEVVARPSEPLWAIRLDEKEAQDNVLKWLNGELGFLMDYNEERLREMDKNLNLYTGVQFGNQQVRTSTRNVTPTDTGRESRHLIINHLYDLTERKVSDTMTTRPAVNINPTNDEYSDEIAAKTTTALWNHIKYTEGFDKKIEKVVRHKYILGEGYLFMEWNPNKGDLHKDSPLDKEGNQRGKREVLLDQNGQATVDDFGKTIYIERPVFIGDVEFKVVLPKDIFIEVKDDYDEATYMFKRELVTTEELRLLYPDSASDIKANADEQMDVVKDRLDKKSYGNQTVLWTLYHKRTAFMPGGREIKFTKDVILKNEKSQYSFENEFPCERLPDIETPDAQHAYSFYRNASAPATHYNKLTSTIMKNQMMAAHPKWMVPAGSAKLSSLGNDITVVQYNGPVPPQLVQSAPTPQEIFVFRDALKADFEQISGVSGVGRGDPPSGITAAVALQFLSEEDSKRSNSALLKYNEFIVGCARKTISIAADFYDEEDGRMEKVLGSNEAWHSEMFQVAHLNKTYDIRVQQSSSLPQTKSGKIQFLFDISDKFPDAVPQAAVADMLDLGQASKFLERVGVSVKAAEAENEAIMAGKEVHEPQVFEGLVDHWQTHVARIRQHNFAAKTPKKVQDNMKDHIMATEYLMAEMARKNPSLLEMMGTLGEFPLFFDPPTPAPAPTADQRQDAEIEGQQLAAQAAPQEEA